MNNKELKLLTETLLTSDIKFTNNNKINGADKVSDFYDSLVSKFRQNEIENGGDFGHVFDCLSLYYDDGDLGLDIESVYTLVLNGFIIVVFDDYGYEFEFRLSNDYINSRDSKVIESYIDYARNIRKW